MPALQGKTYRLSNPNMTPDDIARRLGVRNGGEFPVGYFSDGGKLVARRDAYDILIVSVARSDLQQKACEFADELTADDP